MKNKKNKITLHSLFYNNRFVFVFSIFVAVIIWIVTSMTVSPSVEKTISNVKINFDLKNSVPAQYGLQIFGEQTNTIKVKIRGKRYVVGSVSADDIIATAQTNGVDSAGKKTLLISVKAANSKGDFDIVEYTPTYVEAYFDTYKELTFQIQPDIVSDQIVPEGYMKGEEALSTNEVTVSGPTTEIDKIVRVVARVNVPQPLTRTQIMKASIVALNQYGGEVQNVTLNYGKADVTMTIPVFKVKTLPVTASFANIPDYYKTNPLKVTYSPSQIEIAGAESMIDSMNELNLGTIDFKKLTKSNNEYKFDVSSLSGIKVLSDTSIVTAKVDLSGKASDKFSISDSRISVVNVPDGYSASVSSQKIRNVTIIGPTSEIENLSSADVYARVDLSGKSISVGEQSFVVDVYVENHNGCWAVGDYKAVVKVT